jgi:hypothetical protein
MRAARCALVCWALWSVGCTEPTFIAPEKTPLAIEPQTCDAGYELQLEQCVDIDECATEHGGCDEAASCKNTRGSHTCGDCMAGYVGGKDGACIPTLTDLRVEPGRLTSKLAPATTQYTITVPFAATRITLIPEAPPDVRIEINGAEVKSGKRWFSPPLGTGDNPIEISVRKRSSAERRYALNAARALGPQALLKPTEANDNFGSAVGISGGTVVGGAPYEGGDGGETGAAHVFMANDEGWTEVARLTASNPQAGDLFGRSVSISGDTIAIGAHLEDSNAIGVNGSGNDESAQDSGAVYAFSHDDEAWSQQAYLKASNTGPGDQFGFSVAVDGNTIVVGAPGDDSNATTVNGGQMDSNAQESGAAYVFVREGKSWKQQAYLKAHNTRANDRFGESVAISGDTIVVGAPNEDSGGTGVNSADTASAAQDSGAAYVFTRKGASWVHAAYLKASNTRPQDHFGRVAVAGDTIAVAAPGEDSAAMGAVEGAAQDSGAVYVFVHEQDSWSQRAYLKSSNPGAGDLFGFAVAVWNDAIVVGACREDSAARDPAGDQASDAAIDAGSAYLFQNSNGVWTQQLYLKASDADAHDHFGYAVAIDAGTIVAGAMGWDPMNDAMYTEDAFARAKGAAYVIR